MVEANTHTPLPNIVHDQAVCQGWGTSGLKSLVWPGKDILRSDSKLSQSRSAFHNNINLYQGNHNNNNTVNVEVQARNARYRIDITHMKAWRDKHVVFTSAARGLCGRGRWLMHACDLLTSAVDACNGHRSLRFLQNMVVDIAVYLSVHTVQT